MKQIFVLLILAGCSLKQADQISPPALPDTALDTCDARQFSDVVGQNVTALETQLFLGPVRLIRPGMAVTMDYNERRINIMIDEDEVISSITCG